ncbi:aspartyl protease family protein 2 [Rutidosis leptorrhynchoides]|uniref:aspartyl protease family protein 2 n=1 Tax=Rutidosis leptorrhynchoides TaxID=125765 RepID=UPI003A995A9A
MFLIITIIIIILFTLTHISHSAVNRHNTTVVSDNHHVLKLPLHHINPLQSPSDAISSDTARLSVLLATLHRLPNLPLTSGAYAGAGQYFVTLHLGTPPQPLLLIADTGSDLIWVTCSACRNDCAATRPPHSSFLVRHSDSYSLHHCFDRACKLVPQPRPNRGACKPTRLHSPCRYEYSYADGSITSGFFAKETTSFNSSTGKLLQHDSLAFGCGFKISGPSVSGPSFNGAQGIMGLGRGPISFVTQLGHRFGNKFSYCLKDYTIAPPPTSYLMIGNVATAGKSKMLYTPLKTNPISSTFYYIGIKDVYVDNVKLPISPSVWDIDELGNGGTIVDSGTTLTFIPESAYRHVLAAFRRRVKLPAPAGSPANFDLCYNVSGISRRLSLPRLRFKLVGNSAFSPPVGNYFIDTSEDVKCLALQPVASTGGFSVIGNLMQQGFLFEFDIERSQLGFSRTGCSKS